MKVRWHRTAVPLGLGAFPGLYFGLIKATPVGQALKLIAKFGDDQGNYLITKDLRRKIRWGE